MRVERQNYETAFDRFLMHYQKSKMSVLVGAGLSMNVSDYFRSWRTLMREIVEYVYEDNINLHCENYQHIHIEECDIAKVKSNYIDTILDSEDFLQLASKYIKKKGYRESMDYYIECATPYLTYSSNGTIELKTAKGVIGSVDELDLSVHKALLRCRRFQNIYTTNYDNILEFTSKILSEEDAFYPYNIVTSGYQLSGNLSHNIIKIHGSISDSKDFQFDGDRHLRYIIAQEDYDTYIQKHEAFSYLMRIAMLQGVFCLVGFSGTDPNYLAWVRWMSDILNVGSDDKIYLLDIDGKEVPDDLLSFYSNHHIVVINLWDENVLRRIFENYHSNKLGKGSAEGELGQMTNSDYAMFLFETKQQFDYATNCEKELLESAIIKYKKIILEGLFNYLRLSEENYTSQSYINQDNGISALDREKNNGSLTIENNGAKIETQSSTLVEAKAKFFDYRNLWGETYNVIVGKNDLRDIVTKLKVLKMTCRFSKVIFPQENLMNQLMKKEPLTVEKAYLFALAVSDIGQLPSYYGNYHKDDVELNKQPLWIQLKEREKTLRGASETLNGVSDDWSIYEQLQRWLFHLDFSQAKRLIEDWQAKGVWVQAKVMRMAVYPEYQNEALSLLDKAIKNEKNPSEKLFEVVLANYISGQWPRPYSTDEFWKYGLDGQGDLLSSMMSALRKKEIKPKRRGWIGSTTYLGSWDGDYVKSLRILQFIVDSGIYLSIPGSYIFDVASWYKVFSNLYEHFPYPCFFYSIQYNDKDVQRRIGEDFAYNKELQDFVQDILLKSLDAIGNANTPPFFKSGIFNITGVMYAVVNEDEWFEPFKKTVFKELIDRLKNLQDSDDIVFNVRLALANIRKSVNIDEVFQLLMKHYAINEGIVSDLIANCLSVRYLCKSVSLSYFPNILDKGTLDVLDVLDYYGKISDSDRKEFCRIIVDMPVDRIPHDRVALFRLVNLTRQNNEALAKVKEVFLSMDIWHCGFLNNREFGWSEPKYIRLDLLNDKIVWGDKEFEIIKSNLIRNVSVYKRGHVFLHRDSFMKAVQVQYLSDMLKYIDGLDKTRQSELSEVRADIERLLTDRLQYMNNIDLLMSEQPADVSYACGNIYECILSLGIQKYRNDIDFMIDRAIMKNPIALTCNLKFIWLLVDKKGKELIDLGYSGKIIKLLSVFKYSDTWNLLDIRFAFNYLYLIAKKMNEFERANEIIDFWMEDSFVKKFIKE